MRFACEALDAVGFPHRVGTLIPTGRLIPVIQGHGADADAYAVADADIPVYSNVGSVNPQFVGFWGTPNIVSVMFAYNFSFSLKIRVYRQKIHHSSSLGSGNIRVSPFSASSN